MRQRDVIYSTEYLNRFLFFVVEFYFYTLTHTLSLYLTISRMVCAEHGEHFAKLIIISYLLNDFDVKTGNNSHGHTDV